MNLFDSLGTLPLVPLVILLLALALALFFEAINGFHDTANAVTTVIYTRSLPAHWAVVYSGLLNFVGVLIGGSAVAFGIVYLLPAAVLNNPDTTPLIVMVMSLLFAAVAWNLGTWYVGLPVSSSHTLIGSIVGVGLASSLMAGQGTSGVNWDKALTTLEGLAFAPVLGFVGSALLLLLMRVFIPVPRLYVPPVGDDTPPWWIRAVLILTCGSVSLSHGSNDGQKGMGLILILLFGFLPAHYALNPAAGPHEVAAVVSAAAAVRPAAEKAADNKDAQKLAKNAAYLEEKLGGKQSYLEVPEEERGQVRVAAAEAAKALKKEDIKKLLEDAGVEHVSAKREAIRDSHEHIPLWVVVAVAAALGGGTMVGYRRIVETVAHKIGKSHLTYGQGAAAELVGALTIAGASYIALPVSTTQIVTSGVAGTMVANGNGVQMRTVTRILLAWLLTLPATILLSGVIYYAGIQVFLK